MMPAEHKETLEKIIADAIDEFGIENFKKTTLFIANRNKPEADHLEFIRLDNLVSLERESAELTALEFGGVDNWEWHYESRKDHYVEPYPDYPGAMEYD
uniref:Host RecBCD nuclease inhibitor n=1 Tax=Rhizobium phage IG49 TaxID=3129228 RepID=A0AAU8HZM7_9CAUD